MKKTLALVIALTLALGLWLTAPASEAEPLTWRGYALEAVWLTMDPVEINIPNLREDGQFAMIRLQPAEGTIEYELVNEHAGDDIFLTLSNGERLTLATVLYHRLIQPEGGGFPTVDPQQNNFDALFFLEGGSEADLEGALLAVADGDVTQTLALDAISREKPED